MQPSELRHFRFNDRRLIATLLSTSCIPVLGVDYVRVIEGASNSNELLLFFREAVDITRWHRSVILEPGDTVIMDNCPFHHGRFTEMVLRNMLAEYGVNLLFQPTYSPHLKHMQALFSPDQSFPQSQSDVTGKSN